MEFKEFKEKLFKKAKEEGFIECEVYYIDRESLSISVYDQEVDKYNLNNTFGLSFRGKINGKMGYSYTEILDEDAINMLVEKAKDGALVIESEDEQFIYEGDKEYSTVKTYFKELDNIEADKLIKLALDMEKEAKKYCDKVVNTAGCSVSYGSSNYGIYNTKGLELTNKTNILSAYVAPIVEDKEKKYDGCGYKIGNSINDIDPKKIAKDGVEEALSRIGGRSIESGKYRTVLYNEAMVSLIGAFIGIFKDITVGGIFGVNALVYFAIGYIISYLSKKIYKESKITIFTLILVTTIVSSLITILSSMVVYSNYTTWRLIIKGIVLLPVFNSLAGLILYAVFDKSILKLKED